MVRPARCADNHKNDSVLTDKHVFVPTAQQIPMASYPVQPMYDAYGKPLGHPENLQAGYPMAPQYSGMPPQYAVMQPGAYPPQMMDPAYGQGNMLLIMMPNILITW